jgi:hypothetical protein
LAEPVIKSKYHQYLKFAIASWSGLPKGLLEIRANHIIQLLPLSIRLKILKLERHRFIPGSKEEHILYLFADIFLLKSY